MEEVKLNRFEFVGDGTDFFILRFVNRMLTGVTLGIYSAWAFVKEKQFLYRNTRFIGESFDYHGTGKERFIGTLKYLGIVLVLLVVIFGLVFLLEPKFGRKNAELVSSLFSYLIILPLTPYIIVAALRYRLSRTSYRSVRFRFIGTGNGFFKIIIVNFVLSVITLFFYTSWAYCNYFNYVASHSLYGNRPFKFDGKGSELFGTYVSGFILTLVTCGIYAPWFYVNLRKYIVSHILFEGNRFSLKTLTGEMVFGVMFKNILFIIFTFGFYFPWAVINLRKLILSHLVYEGDIDFDSIIGSFSQAEALGDVATDLGDMALPGDGL
ncbi:MAG: DUF898 family protein [Leptospiraceae bacterium]|nr:DUF898 family protein [Leptospiraceae bacterium]